MSQKTAWGSEWNGEMIEREGEKKILNTKYHLDYIQLTVYSEENAEYFYH